MGGYRDGCEQEVLVTLDRMARSIYGAFSRIPIGYCFGASRAERRTIAGCLKTDPTLRNEESHSRVRQTTIENHTTHGSKRGNSTHFHSLVRALEHHVEIHIPYHFAQRHTPSQLGIFGDILRFLTSTLLYHQIHAPPTT